MYKYLMLLALLLTLSLGGCVSPQVNPADATTTGPALARGINLGDILDAPAEGAWGEIWQDQYATLIKAAGFDHVRLPVMFSNYAELKPPYPIDQAILARTDHIIQTCQAAGLAVILDLHNYYEMDETPAQERERFLAIWQGLANHYAGYSNQLLFEVLNEPVMDQKLWNSLLADAVKVIRAKNPERYILISGAGWLGAQDLYNLILPADPKLIGTFHMYFPFEFTHQGANWVGPEADTWLGTSWTGTVYDQSEIEMQMVLAKAWSQSRHLPVHMGEFGAYEKAPYANRVAWTEYVARSAESSGISWSYWEFCAGFGIYDDQTNTYNQELLDALIPKQ